MKKWIWRVFGLAIIYATVVVAVATMAQPAKPGDPFDMSRSFGHLVKELPGSWIAVALIDFDAHIWGLPLPIIVIGSLLLAGIAVFKHADKLAHEASVARDEAIREGVRRRRYQQDR